MEKMRTFICIEISDSKIINEIAKVQREFSTLKGRIKSTEQENIHLTLKFLGNITKSECDEIINLLDQVKFKKFTMTLHGIGCFPGPSRPRIVWVGVTSGADKVEDIYNQINKLLRKFHFKKEAFKSHITISRIKFMERSSSTKFKKLLDQFRDKHFGDFKVSSFQFKKSTLTPKGPIYTTLKEFKSNE
ncbi:MAG: RNA 2',3'-cyclic phosphodiesterase [Candidatus Helarchaeota archaeon]